MGKYYLQLVNTIRKIEVNETFAKQNNLLFDLALQGCQERDVHNNLSTGET